MDTSTQQPLNNYNPDNIDKQKRVKKILYMTGLIFLFILITVSAAFATWKVVTQKTATAELTYPIVDTMQKLCYDDSSVVECTKAILQDANYSGLAPSYKDNGDGTITDNVTGLMWQQDAGAKVTYSEGSSTLSNFKLANYSDWRIPTVKELYSLIQFNGIDPNSCRSECPLVPFINQEYFKIKYGDISAGEKAIDSNFMTSTKYASNATGGDEVIFGVNFVDGKIRGHTVDKSMKYYLLHVRGNSDYGKNRFSLDNQTVKDEATGLIWQKEDSASAKTWTQALSYCEDLDLSGKTDWRLPNAKELQSIVDYTKSPDATNSPAIDSNFTSTSITNEASQKDWPYYWTSTTYAADDNVGTYAVYIAFGRAMGYVNNSWTDTNGAGAQRSDPKVGDANIYSKGIGSQGDAVRISNYARCVRGGI